MGRTASIFASPRRSSMAGRVGLTYQQAALLDKQIVTMKAKAQFFRKGPHRIATVHEFAAVKK